MKSDRQFEEANRDRTLPYALNVLFHAKKNDVVTTEGLKKYPIGGMMCEYARLRPSEIKPIITSNPYFHYLYDSDILFDALLDFFDRMNKQFGLISAHIIVSEMFDYMEDMIRADREGHKLAVLGTDDIKDFILDNTGYDKFGTDTIGQLFLSAYATYASSYMLFKDSFQLVMKSAANEQMEKDEERRLDIFFSIYTERMDFQHIDFKLVFLDGKVQSLFRIKNGLSLLLFEVAHAIEFDTPIQKCEHCKQYFVPEGRSDMVYCSFPSPEDPNKTCREIGAQYKRVQKEKNDIVTREYRKVYMRYTMHLKRHPEDEEKKAQFEKLKSEVKEWRKNIANETATVDEFLVWLNTF